MIEKMLEKLKFKTITPIQEGVFKRFDNPKHLVALAKTGTGKTHAYLLPLLASITDKQAVQGVVLVPTNELVIQVYKMIKEVSEDIQVKAYYGSQDKDKEIRWLSKNQPQIVISTPQQLIYYTQKQVLKIHEASYVIFDEADMMFDEAFLSMIDTLLTLLKTSKYILLSATLTQAMKPFIKSYFGQFELIDTTKIDAPNIEYLLIKTQEDRRLETLIDVARSINPYLCFVFVSQKEELDKVYETLSNEVSDVAKLSGSLGVKERKKIIEGIQKGTYRFVVSSDLGARGLDFVVSHVIQYDLPNNIEYFMHRSGRTGRMNREGIVLTLYTPKDARKIEKLKQKGIPFKKGSWIEGAFKGSVKKTNKVLEHELEAIKKIKKPTKVKPNYKKKNQELIKKAKKQARKKVLYG